VNKLEFWANRADYGRLVHLFIQKVDLSGVFRANPLTFSTECIDDSVLIVDPTITMSAQDAQVLMDELWRCGLRPTEGSGSAGSLAATQDHLRDMRTIVAKQLDVTLDSKR
jgi:hypothetical protein